VPVKSRDGRSWFRATETAISWFRILDERLDPGRRRGDHEDVAVLPEARFGPRPLPEGLEGLLGPDVVQAVEEGVPGVLQEARRLVVLGHAPRGLDLRGGEPLLTDPGELPHVDLDPVDPEQLAGDVEGLGLRLEVLEREVEVPVRALHVEDGRDRRQLQPLPLDPDVVFGGPDVGGVVGIPGVLEEGLGDGELGAAGIGRIEDLEARFSPRRIVVPGLDQGELIGGPDR
jgi:hypothetical protein